MADDLNLLHGTVTDGGGSRTFANPGNANDGVLASSAFQSGYVSGSNETGYLETDLGSAFAVAESIVWGDHECGSDATNPDNGWSIEASDDGSSWSAIGYTVSSAGVPGTDDYRVRFVFDSPETHRYFRFVYKLTPATGFQCGDVVRTWELFGETSPTEPPVDPGYEPPLPGHAILEIYVHDEDATRWGTAEWGDNPPVGATGVWSGAGWVDVTPEGVRAHVRWGTSRPERGILAVQEAQSWEVETYDPERVLDPGNPDSPYAPQLVSGVPIRVSSSVSGRVIRTGIIDEITYNYRAPQYRGTIRGSSTIAALWRAGVAADAVLGNTLDSRIRDAVAASGIYIGGIPILRFGDSFPDIPLSDRIPDDQSAWTHIYKAGEEVLWTIYEDESGALASAPSGGGLDRGSEITYANLEDLQASSSEDGIYSVVRVQPADPDDPMIERVASPLPRYGRIPYERRETTIDPEAWAAAVLADRAWPGVVWTPGVVWCFTEADVDFMASLQITERLHIVVPGVVDVSGVLVGMELWVEAKDDDETRWLFLPVVATASSASLGTTTLIADDGSGDFLVDDSTGDDFLEYEG